MQTFLKQLPLALLVSFALNACVTINTPTPIGSANSSTNQNTNNVGYRPAASHWSDVAKIRQEAQRLGAEVGAGKLTKVQAAQYLNRYRLSLVGSNQIDDSMYEVYQKAALDSQRGVISQEQSKQYIISALKGWQQRWSSMSVKPANPAFTNFLMEVMELQPLK